LDHIPWRLRETGEGKSEEKGGIPVVQIGKLSESTQNRSGTKLSRHPGEREQRRELFSKNLPKGERADTSARAFGTRKEKKVPGEGGIRW